MAGRRARLQQHHYHRRKRDTAGRIYSVCSMWGNCPRDVKNKVERTTVADKILQYGSAGVFLGNLAISSSVPTVGGIAADAVVGQAVRMGAREVTLEPDIPLASLGPRPGRVPMRQELPHIYELSHRTLSTFIEDTPSTLVLEQSSVAPKVQISGEDNTALVEVPRRPAGRHRVSRMQYDNPAFKVAVHTNIEGAETSASDHVAVFAPAGGHQVGEEIPLHTLGRFRLDESTIDDTMLADTDIDMSGTGQRTSTPVKPRVTRPATGPGSRGPRRTGIMARLFNRRTAQIPVPDEEFMTNPATLVTFENPAFDASMSLIFEQDLQGAAAAAPHPDFQDIIRLGRPVLSEVPTGGRVRVSRLGKRGTIKTRSGLKIGGDVHFFRDLSSIAPAAEEEELEMEVLGEQSGISVLHDSRAVAGVHSTTEIGDTEPGIIEVDDTEENISHVVHVNYGGTGTDNHGLPFPDFSFSGRTPTVIVETERGIPIGRPEAPLQPPVQPEDTPLVIIDPVGTGANYFLHPSLLRKKKKKLIFH
ncbi:L2 [Miniopterus schreibersii papillomavirus 1]|uniref:Minor capsid protein L2 n=1 Tax=Miniopterus schreibersii papillomavirus 1 TaxID=1195364 RepID=J9R372_9PAPI|nr:L2 [Miniopterus schreibersii papillomavirus 1]AFR33948.1 L2 [Miniopterus schreibersii papillomavirus 1]